MDRALYVAMTGATHLMRAQTANSHNLANASTIGFRAEMESARSLPIEGAIHASRVNAVLEDSGWDPTQGHLQTTGRNLDVALRGDGFMAVQAPDGTEAYTRNGSLRLTPEGLLTTASGQPLLGDNGPIAIPPAESLTIGDDGTISIVPAGQPANTLSVVGRIRVVDAQPGQLVRGGDGLMRAADGVELLDKAGATLIPGTLESSNVNTAEAMVNMIELSRQFELQVKLIKAAEDNARQASSLSRISG